MKSGFHANSKSSVFFARNYEEAHKIEISRPLGGKRTAIILKRLFVRLWVFFANTILALINRLFFENNFRNISPQRIAVYTVGTLGDNVLMLPAVAALKNKFASARITAIANCDGFSDKPARAILGNSSLIDEFVSLPVHPVQRQGLRLRVNIPENITKGFDLFVNLSPFGNRGWIGAVIREFIYAKKIDSKTAIGFKMATYSRRNIFNKVQHYFVKNEAQRTDHILRKVGISPIYDKDLLSADEGAKNKVLELISTYIKDREQPIAIINPGAKLSASHWPADRFGELAFWLKQKYDMCVFVNGTESEKNICEKVVESSRKTTVDLSGLLSIQELIELLRLSKLLVTNNTGPMTLAGMIKTPMVVISSTRFSPAFYMPESDNMVWIFSFDKNSYTYNDEDGPGSDLRNIEVRHVQQAINMLDSFRQREVFNA